jgi:hypothetical protein
MSPDQERQKKEARKRAHHHLKHGADYHTLEEDIANQKREQSERGNDPEHYDEYGYRRLQSYPVEK